MSETRLEEHLRKGKLQQKCSCDFTAPVMKMAHNVYLGCPKCNMPVSKVITVAEALEIQTKGAKK